MSRSFIVPLLGCFLLPTLFASRYFSNEEALNKLFPHCDATKTLLLYDDYAKLPLELADQIKNEPRLKGKRFAGEFALYGVRDSADQLLGWAVLTEEMGMHQPITLMVAILPNGEVKDVLLLVYRESRGLGVKHPKFRGQFKAKTGQDPLAVGNDITYVSGSTISSRSMARGVQKALFLVEHSTLAKN